jgi:pyrimidine operon attenuation protein/uracil phosphoribosyltransferase
VRLAILVDRGHRELPIRPTSSARTSRAPAASVNVHLAEDDGIEEVTIAS